MLTSLQRMTGMPVVWKDETVGYVEQAVPDTPGHRLSGLIIRKGLRSARWCPAEGIELIGQSCVVLCRRPAALGQQRNFEQQQAYLTSGQYAGVVTDGLILPDTLVMRAIQISPGPIHRLMGYCAYACDYSMANGGVVIPALLSWAQLKSRIGEEDLP